MNQQPYICELREQHVDQAARVLTRSFLHLNQIWKNFNPTYDNIFPIIRGKILPSIRSGWSFVLIRDSQVIGVSVEYEMIEYLKMPSMPTDLELFNKLDQAGHQLQKKININPSKIGQSIYGLYGVIDPEEASKGLSSKFWWNLFAIAKIAGWRYYYSRISSQLSLKMLKRLGAQELGCIQLDQSLGGQKLWMIRVDLYRPLPSYSMFNALISQRQPKPKL